MNLASSKEQDGDSAGLCATYLEAYAAVIAAVYRKGVAKEPRRLEDRTEVER